MLSDGGTSRDTPDAFSIRLVSRLTGFTPETLRMWEYRYGFPKPLRGPSKRRIYTASDVDVLCLIARAMASGYRPSEVVGKNLDELKTLVNGVQVAIASSPRAHRKSSGNMSVESLVDLLLLDDVEQLQAELRRQTLTRSPKALVVEVVQPLLTFMGIQWQRGRLEIRHEHLMSALLTTQLRIAQRQCETPPGAPVVVLATLPGERHSLGIEMAALYLASCRVRAIFLGPEMPAEQLVAAAQSFGAAAVGVTITEASDLGRTREGVRYLVEFLPEGVQLWLGGEGAARLTEFGDRVVTVPTWMNLELAVQGLA